MKVLNFGSLNVDHVYGLDHIVRPGETLGDTTYQRFAGGKGANQSVALARAGALVSHAGKVGPESVWLKDRLGKDGIDVSHILVDDGPGGHAIIQVEKKSAQNAIVLFGGANQKISTGQIKTAIADCAAGDILLLQNEINALPAIIRTGAEAGLRVCFNPAPMDEKVAVLPLELLELLIVNEHEGADLAGSADPEKILDTLSKKYPETKICLTLGGEGSLFFDGSQLLRQRAYSVAAVDTTAAGDTFIGFLLAAMLAGKNMADALDLAAKAAALSVTKPGALDSIPTLAEVLAHDF